MIYLPRWEPVLVAPDFLEADVLADFFGPDFGAAFFGDFDAAFLGASFFSDSSVSDSSLMVMPALIKILYH